MESLLDTNPVVWALIILLSATVFTCFWLLDALTHAKLVAIDITDKELQTHRNILIGSFLMELSLIGMYWYPWFMLPLFIAFFITRTSQEFIDELHFHTDRCLPYESRLHLIMWLTVLTKTAAMFIWGFFMQFKGLENLPILFYLWGIVLVLVMGYTSFVEYRR